MMIRSPTHETRTHRHRPARRRAVVADMTGETTRPARRARKRQPDFCTPLERRAAGIWNTQGETENENERRTEEVHSIEVPQMQG